LNTISPDTQELLITEKIQDAGIECPASALAPWERKVKKHDNGSRLPRIGRKLVNPALAKGLEAAQELC
jgi:hypothetical protein